MALSHLVRAAAVAPGDLCGICASSAPSTGEPQPRRNITQHDETPRNDARDRLLDRLAPQFSRAHAGFAVCVPVEIPAESVGAAAVSGGEFFGHCLDELPPVARRIASQGTG
jgi:hypothetical protein